LSLAPYTEDLVGAWASYLQAGGFPQAVADWRRANEVSVTTIHALWDVVRGDALTTAMSEAELGSVLDGMSKRLTSLVNMSSFARDTGLGVVALETRIASLVSTFLAWHCPRADETGAPDTGKQSKLYFLDPLVAQLPHLLQGSSAVDITRMSEQQLGVALLEWNETVRPGSVRSAQWVTHHRGSKSNEIDFVGRCADTLARAVPLEGKYVSGNWRQEALAIANSTLREGILATRDITEVSVGEPVWAVPAPFVALALNSFER
jgi:predicted AAA+ superfamily ATPase